MRPIQLIAFLTLCSSTTALAASPRRLTKLIVARMNASEHSCLHYEKVAIDDRMALANKLSVPRPGGQGFNHAVTTHIKEQLGEDVADARTGLLGLFGITTKGSRMYTNLHYARQDLETIDESFHELGFGPVSGNPRYTTTKALAARIAHVKQRVKLEAIGSAADRWDRVLDHEFRGKEPHFARHLREAPSDVLSAEIEDHFETLKKLLPEHEGRQFRFGRRGESGQGLGRIAFELALRTSRLFKALERRDPAKAVMIATNLKKWSVVVPTTPASGEGWYFEGSLNTPLLEFAEALSKLKQHEGRALHISRERLVEVMTALKVDARRIKAALSPPLEIREPEPKPPQEQPVSATQVVHVTTPTPTSEGVGKSLLKGVAAGAGMFGAHMLLENLFD